MEQTQEQYAEIVATICMQIKSVVNLAKQAGLADSVILGMFTAEWMSSNITEKNDVATTKVNTSLPTKKPYKSATEKMIEKNELIRTKLADKGKESLENFLESKAKNKPDKVDYDSAPAKEMVHRTASFAHKIAEKRGQGYSYFGKFFIDKRAFQKQLHLTGEIKKYTDEAFENGRSMQDAVEEWCLNHYGNIIIDINRTKCKFSDYIKKTGISAGYVRAEKLDDPRISWEKAIKRVSARMKKPVPTKDDLKDITYTQKSYEYIVTPITKPIDIEVLKTGRKSIPIDYHGEHFKSKSEFYTAYKITGQYIAKVHEYESSKMFKDIGDAFDHFLQMYFEKRKDVELNDMVFEDMVECLDFYHIDYCDLWVYMKNNKLSTVSDAELLEKFVADNPGKFRRATGVSKAHKILAQPCEFEGVHYATGMDLIREYGIGMVQAIGTIADRGLSPAELIKYHLDGNGNFIEAKDSRLNQKKKEETEMTPEQRRVAQSYTKIGTKRRNTPVTYNDKEFRSVNDGCDQLGIATEYQNVRRRMSNGMTFEEAVDDVLMNKKKTGRKSKEEDGFSYQQVDYDSLYEACNCYDIKESSVRNYARAYGVKLEVAFGIIVGDIKEDEVGIKKKKAFVAK